MSGVVGLRGVNVSVPTLFIFFLGVLLLNTPIPDLPMELRRLGQSELHGWKPHHLAVPETSVAEGHCGLLPPINRQQGKVPGIPL